MNKSNVIELAGRVESQGKFVLSQNPPPLRISCHFQVVKHPSHIHDEVTHGLSNPL